MGHLKNWDDFYRKIHSYFNGIIAITLLPFAFVFLELDTSESSGPTIINQYLIAFHIIMISASTILLYYAHKTSTRALNGIDSSQSVFNKLWLFFKIQRGRYLFMGLASFIALAGLYLTNNYLYAFLYVFILFLFSMIRPTYDHIVKQLRLNKKDREFLESNRESKH